MFGEATYSGWWVVGGRGRVTAQAAHDPEAERSTLQGSLPERHQGRQPLWTITPWITKGYMTLTGHVAAVSNLCQALSKE